MSSTVHPSFQLPEHPADSQPGWIRTAKKAIPKPLRDALKPIARKIYPGALLPEPLDLSPCDRPVGNHHTIQIAAQQYKFFFLCGCWKSGTHWVANILNLHPHINIKGEHHFEEIAHCRKNLTTPTWFMAHRPRLGQVTQDALENVVRRMLFFSTRDRPRALWLGDHTPRLLVPVLRDAPHIHLTRDGRDILISWAYHWLRVQNINTFLPQFRHLGQKWVPEFTKDPDKFRDPSIGLLGDDHWVRHACCGWVKFMQHDARAIPTLKSLGVPIHAIRYETLHADVETERTRLYRFLNLDPVLAEPLSEKTKTLPGFKKEQLQSHYRKGQVGDWRSYFDDRLKRIFKEEAGQTLIDAGYERDLNW